MEFGTMMGLLLSGLQFTAIIFVITLVGALPLGVLVALGRTSKFTPPWARIGSTSRAASASS